jgi:hypothetical protein
VPSLNVFRPDFKIPSSGRSGLNRLQTRWSLYLHATHTPYLHAPCRNYARAGILLLPVNRRPLDFASSSGRNLNYDEKQLTGENILSCSFNLYRFRKYLSYGFRIIHFCNPGVHFETLCICVQNATKNVGCYGRRRAYYKKRRREFMRQASELPFVIPTNMRALI